VEECVFKAMVPERGVTNINQLVVRCVVNEGEKEQEQKVD
jgi:hypothetical protein